jgi:GTP-binding protein EngB required for normal cell division
LQSTIHTSHANSLSPFIQLSNFGYIKLAQDIYTLMMPAQTSESDTLERLQTSEQIALLDAIDHLRSRGVTNHDISLPQLIVCGEQSSGKSSVLGALTGLAFPTKDAQCTTFATEIILRKQTDTKITCAISPGKGRSPAQKAQLSKFSRSYTTRKDFPFASLLDEARNFMTFGTSSGTTSFSNDVLQINCMGPDVPSLTIIDLPGLIQAQIEGKYREGVRQVHDLVHQYMKDERSIILAVVSARNDLDNQSIFKKLQEIDPDGSRSLGILTKPDTLDQGSESEIRCLNLAKNQVHKLKLGWHVVKNRGFKEISQTDAERDDSEKVFLASGVGTRFRAPMLVSTL